MSKDIKKLYAEVFDEKGNIKSCSRDVCKSLIKEMERLYPGINFGSSSKGIMHPINIQKYIKEI